MRISDWSSDVCSSDLPGNHHFQITACTGHRHDAWLDYDRCGDRAVPDPFQRFVMAALEQSGAVHPFCGGHRPDDFLVLCNPATSHPGRFRQIVRASVEERMMQFEEVSVAAVSL